MIIKIPKTYLEYLPLLIILWNYPHFDDWNVSHTGYLIATCSSTIANAIYVNAMYVFMTESNVLENYNNMLKMHIYKTIVNGLSSYTTMLAVYSRQYDSFPFILLVSLMNHFMVSYMYYFGDLTYTHHYALMFKQIPHTIDVIIMIGCVTDAELQKCVFIANAGMMMSIYMKNQYVYRLFSMMETYSICKMVNL